jgi:heptosyltransferase-2
MILRSECTHFPGDRPCLYNKREGVHCDRCPYYVSPSTRILIIKLDAIDDVLRTTCILHGLKEQYPGSEITWITRKNAVELFEQNTLVDRVLAYESTASVLHAAVEEFDVIINLDAAADSAVLASAVRGKERIGYGLNGRGDVVPFNPEAERWLEMGAFDDLKKKNAQSFQDLMLDICRLKTKKKEIILSLSEPERAFAASFAQRFHLDARTPKIGLNTGASGRWQFKQWTLDGYEQLIRLLIERTNAAILLYGGPSEKERNDHLASISSGRIINTGTENTLRQFFALVNLSDLFVTGDTLALHAATALKKKVIALFGPTSAAEIDSYDGQIIKIQADLDCLVCYKQRCDFNPNCMNSITAEQLFGIVQKTIA